MMDKVLSKFPLTEQRSMVKLLFKLYKNENNTDISLYLIHLQKLQENILKYSRLNLFKEITIGFQMILESLAYLSDSLLGKCCNYPRLQFLFGVAHNFVALSINYTPHRVIKEIAI